MFFVTNNSGIRVGEWLLFNT